MMNDKAMKNSQTGLAMLTVTLLLLVSATSFTFFSVKSRMMEAKISSNDYRYRETFVNAEAGLEHAISFLSSSGWQNSVPGLAKTTVAGKFVYSLAKANVYDVTITDECAGCGLVTVASTGKGDSGTLERTISKIAVFPPQLTPIRSPLITAGGTNMTGAIHLLPKDPTRPTDIAADNAMDSGGKNINVNGNIDTDGGSIQSNNSSLRGDNLAKFIGVRETDWESFANDPSKVIRIQGCSGLNAAATASTADIDSKKWKTVWVHTDECLTSDITGALGSNAKPVKIVFQDVNVLDRDASGNPIAGTMPDVYGLLYAFNTSATNPARKYARFKFLTTGNFNGSLIFDYKYTFSYQASLKVIYRQDLLDKVQETFTDGSAAYWLPGGWNDLS